ncbi:MAG TPA: transposase [Terriglobia bacterium]|nr:transposase [Terriglobia bacterium]
MGRRVTLGGMSRLGRLVLSDRFFFVSCRLARDCGPLSEPEFEQLARVVSERRNEHGFLLTAWVFLPGHWHAIIFPRHPLTISRVMEAIKVGSTLRVNGSRKRTGRLWQGRFFDRALRAVREYNAKVEYIHLNPVKAGLVRRAEDWPWSSAREYSGSIQETATRHPFLPIDRVLLPSEGRTRI